MGASAWLICTAPVMTSCDGGTCTVRKTLPAGVSAMPLLPRRMCFSITSFSGSRATSAALTSRCSPLATSVTTTAARRAVRSALRALRMSSFMADHREWRMASSTRRQFAARPSHPLLHLLHIDPDGAATGEPDLPGGLVGDTEFERLGLAALDHVERFGHHRALDAAARDATEEIALIVDHQVRTHRPRRRAPGLDHGRERDPASFRPPVLGRPQDVFIAREHFLLHRLDPHPRSSARGPSLPFDAFRWIAGARPAMTITPPCPTKPLDRRR